MYCCLLSEGPTDGLGLQECEKPWECVGPHVPDGYDVSDHHWPHSGQGQVLYSHNFWVLSWSPKALSISLEFPIPTNFYTPCTEFFDLTLDCFDSCCRTDDRCIKLALVHDMAECIVGDIAPADNISKAEKHRREEASDNDVGTRPVTTWHGESSYRQSWT